ncbi:hypothetical protein D3C78_1292160 [compost metagenome]
MNGSANRMRYLRGAGRLVAPFDQRPGKVGCVDIRQQRLHADHRPGLLSCRNDQRRMRVPCVAQCSHRIAGACRGVQVDEGWLAAGLCIAISDTNNYRFLKGEDVSKVLGEVFKKGQLIGTRVTEDRINALTAKKLIGCAMYRSHGDLSLTKR